ncbi:Yip1 family protein [Rhodalgimonas zhirmunskyi]|uniref:YIP1 family protein n=1 Tax=Rhodalgimonas zhirmunskyi TaxID=2964767 RepID=A0AAJ1UBT1_9RHOB|nr:Yip1 family protein [Rhodoalgimonas zhirmunskyi]MDQ2093012.1 YIP1 family protein [Rhodoalgimonas zhirmunskyi]
MSGGFLGLIRQTFLDPKGAAGQVIALRAGISHEMLWGGVIAVALVNAVVASLWMIMVPPPDELMQLYPRFVHSPVMLAVAEAGVMVTVIFALHWAGRAFGGKGALWDVLAVLSWLVFVQAVARGALLIVTLAIPPLGSLAVTVLFFWGIWILIAFVDRVHEFNSPLRAIGVLMTSFGLMVVGVMLLSLLIGVTGGGLMQAPGAGGALQ